MLRPVSDHTNSFTYKKNEQRQMDSCTHDTQKTAPMQLRASLFESRFCHREDNGGIKVYFALFYKPADCQYGFGRF